MAHLGTFETPDRRLMRLRSALDSTVQDMDQIGSQAVDLEGRRRAMEDSLRRFREVEQRQQPSRLISPSGRTFTTGEITTPEERLAASAPPVSPLPAPGGFGIGGAALEGIERARTQVTAPIAATGLQIAESPIGSAIPGVRQLKELGRRVEDIGVPEAISPLPRTRTFDETGRFVNPFAAIAGDEEEQERAQAVLQEAGLPRSLAAELIIAPENVIPGIGFTKIDDFARLLRIATKAKGAVKVRALKVLAESDLFQQARRGITEAGEVGGRPPPLRGGEGGLSQLRKLRISKMSDSDLVTLR